jgi:putative holliday junction resolvase
VSATSDNTVIGLDIGDARIGVARAALGSFFPAPCDVILNDDRVYDRLKECISANKAVALVVGLPRNLSGDDTAQTKQVRSFASMLEQHLTVPIYFQDEAGTTKRAEQELNSHKRPPKGPAGSVDALAAAYILEDFLQQEANRELFT